MTDLWDYIDHIMLARYEGLTMRRMSLGARLAPNTVGNIKAGHNPKAETLRALAVRWGRTPVEVEEDYREMMQRSGKAAPADRRVSDEEWEWVQRFRELKPEQRDLARLFFRTYGTGDTLDILAQGLRPPGVTRPTPVEAFQEFLSILGQVSELSPEECILVIADALRRVQGTSTSSGSRGPHEAQ